MPRSDWLRQPVVEFRDEEGMPSALVRLRDAPFAYTVQPNSECLVFFHLGADHWPVAVEFLEAIPGRVVFQVLTRLIETQGGEPAVALEPAHKFVPLTSSEIVAVLRAMDEAQGKLAAAATT